MTDIEICLEIFKRMAGYNSEEKFNIIVDTLVTKGKVVIDEKSYNKYNFSSLYNFIKVNTPPHLVGCIELILDRNQVKRSRAFNDVAMTFAKQIDKTLIDTQDKLTDLMETQEIIDKNMTLGFINVSFME